MIKVCYYAAIITTLYLESTVNSQLPPPFEQYRIRKELNIEPALLLGHRRGANLSMRNDGSNTIKRCITDINIIVNS